MSLSREIQGHFFLCIRIDSPIGAGGVSDQSTPHPILKYFFIFFVDCYQAPNPRDGGCWNMSISGKLKVNYININF